MPTTVRGGVINERTTPSQPETRQRIVGAAIQLFAERGFEATSIRDITAAAQCNVASVNYHFGGKDNLYVEAARSLLSGIQDQRMAFLAARLESPEADDLEGFLASFAQAFVNPLVSGPHSRVFMSWFAREMIDPRLPAEVFFGEFIQPFMGLALTGLERFLPDATPAERLMCLMSVVGQLIHIVKGFHLIARTERELPLIPNVEDQITHVVRFSAGGIRAIAASTRPDPSEA